MKDNLGLMLILFGLPMIWWIIVMFILPEITILSIVCFTILWIMWLTRPRGESKKWDKFRVFTKAIFMLPVYLTSYKKFIGV
jgi:hypothetical protein